MTDNNIFRNIFSCILGVNSRISGLPKIAEEIRLISCNAETAASRAGESGKPLRVMTHDIDALSSFIDEKVSIISSTVTKCTREMAEYAGAVNKLNAYQEISNSLMSIVNTNIAKQNVKHINKVIDKVTFDSNKKYHNIPRYISDMIMSFSEIADQIRIGEMVGISIEIEVASASTKDSNLQVFRVLSEKLRQSCEEMRRATTKCNQMLVNARELTEERRFI